MTSAIQAANLTRSFGKTLALNGLSLDVPIGSIYALVGANGAGKTTVIKILMNILRATSGSATVLGRPSSEIGGAAFTCIGYVSENQELPEWMTVEYLLSYLRSFYPQWDSALEQQLIRQLDLPLERKLKHLSRGQRMKAALASILAYRPSLIVLDEPFTGLDPLVRDELIESLLERAPETTIFLSSHDLAEIESFASHVGYLERGQMLFSEEMSSLADRFREVQVTLDQPTPLPSRLPSLWLQPESSGTVLRFIDSAFHPSETPRQIAQLFPTARDISPTAMPLRSIFLAVAKAGRRPTPVQSIAQQNVQETEA
jgi:ABC-2 type transport system ATP-binding protein